MFANFTEETCTGTGVTLALAGAITGMIPFSESFADGDLIAYALEDSGGTIKVTGVGIYVSATDDITRNDTWNWNGTVIDKNPSTNITLSGGTHTVRCDITQSIIRKRSPMTNSPSIQSGQHFVGAATATVATIIALVADRMYVYPLLVEQRMSFTNLIFGVQATGTAANVRVGLYKEAEDGDVGLLIVQAELAVGTTGAKASSITETVEPGTYWIAWVADGTVSTRQASLVTGVPVTVNKYDGNGAYGNGSSYRNFTYASLPADNSGNSWTGDSKGVYSVGVTV